MASHERHLERMMRALHDFDSGWLRGVDSSGLTAHKGTHHPRRERRAAMRMRQRLDVIRS